MVPRCKEGVRPAPVRMFGYLKNKQGVFWHPKPAAVRSCGSLNLQGIQCERAA